MFDLLSTTLTRRRRTATSAWITLVGLTLIMTLSTMLITMMSIPKTHAERVKRIAVLELKNRAQSGVSQTELSYLTNEVRLIMSYLPKDQFLVMTKESMLMLIEPGKTLEDCVGECEVETGRLINADWIITGELLRFGSSIPISYRVPLDSRPTIFCYHWVGVYSLPSQFWGNPSPPG